MLSTTKLQSKKHKTLARLVSNLANPLIIPPAVLWVLAWSGHLDIYKTLSLVGISLVFFTVLPLISAIIYSSDQHLWSLDFPDQSSRTPLYSISTAITLIGSVLVVTLFDEPYLQASVTIFWINIFAAFLLNFKWKVSVHSSAITTGGFCLLLFSSLGTAGFPSFHTGLFLFVILLPLVGWARHQLDIHSISEIIGGISLGLILSSLTALVLSTNIFSHL